VQAAGVKLDPALLQRIDEVLGDGIERDPAQTASQPRRP